MKFSLVAVLLVVLAVAHTSEAGSLTKGDVQSEVNRLTKLIKNISASITGSTEDVKQRLKGHQVTQTTQTQMQYGHVQFEPLVNMILAETTKLHAQIKHALSNIDSEIKYIADHFNAQIKHLSQDLQYQIKPLTETLNNLFQHKMQTPGYAPTKGKYPNVMQKN